MLGEHGKKRSRMGRMKIDVSSHLNIEGMEVERLEGGRERGVFI